MMFTCTLLNRSTNLDQKQLCVCFLKVLFDKEFGIFIIHFVIMVIFCTIKVVHFVL